MREIIEEESFKEAVERLGGARAIDQAMDAVIDALYNDPYGFEAFENDWVRFRYARTKSLQTHLVPPLVVIFTIDSETNNVILHHVEEDQDAS